MRERYNVMQIKNEFESYEINMLNRCYNKLKQKSPKPLQGLIYFNLLKTHFNMLKQKVQNGSWF